MQRRATEIASRRKELQHKRTNVADERTALALTTSGHVQIRPDIALDPPPKSAQQALRHHTRARWLPKKPYVRLVATDGDSYGMRHADHKKDPNLT
jgi:hypothetical protein